MEVWGISDYSLKKVELHNAIISGSHTLSRSTPEQVTSISVNCFMQPVAASYVAKKNESYLQVKSEDENVGDEATEQSLGESSLALPEPSNSPRSEPDSQEPLLSASGGGGALSLWAEECSSHLCHSSRRGNALACWRLSR